MNAVLSILKNVGLVILAWLIAFGGVKLGVHGWLGISLLQVGACVVCSVLAIHFNAPLGLAILSINGISIGVETLIHATYGIDKVQGFPSHLAVILSVTLGLLVGRFLLTARVTATTSA
jgi:hypothetical protein